MSVWSVPIAAHADPSSFLEDILSTRINISKALRSSASYSQCSLRELLVGEARRDPSFPRVLVESDQDFIGGSFARRTKVAPLDDIDVYVPLDGGGFIYACRGVQTGPLLSDNPARENPLLSAKWMGGDQISSGALLAAFADVLRRRHPNTTRVRKQVGEAVRVQITSVATGASQDLADLGYDVVPCLVPDYPDSRELRVYLVPDGNNGWVRTNPRYDAALTDALSARTNKNFRKAVKIVKFWSSSIFRSTLSSYYIELALQKAALEHLSAGESIEPLSFAVAFAFSALNQAVRSGSLNSWVTSAPRVTPGSLSASDYDLLNSLSSVAWQAWELERQWELQDASLRWELIFGA
jgi:hypothetical protein